MKSLTIDTGDSLFSTETERKIHMLTKKYKLFAIAALSILYSAMSVEAATPETCRTVYNGCVLGGWYGVINCDAYVHGSAGDLACRACYRGEGGCKGDNRNEACKRGCIAYGCQEGYCQ